MEGEEHRRKLGIILQNISKTNEQMTTTSVQMKEEVSQIAELLRSYVAAGNVPADTANVAESSEAR